MHCHQSLWKDGNPLFYGDGLRRACPTSAAGTSAACSSTPGRCSRSPHRRPTPTSASCPGTRRRSTWCTRSATARRHAASRSTRRAPRPSGSSSAAPTRRATRTSRSRRCSWPGSTGCRTGSSRPTRWTRTSTTSPRRSCEGAPGAGSLDEALAALEADHDFLKAGGVFTDDLIETWIEYKRLNEVDADPAASASLGVHALLRHLGLTRAYPLSSLEYPYSYPAAVQ